MGNVPTKFEQNSMIGEEQSNTPHGRKKSSSVSVVTSRSGNDFKRNRSSSIAATLLGSHQSRARAQSTSVTHSSRRKKRSTRERERSKENHGMQLVIKYDESVDGGYLAPFGCYSFEKLDYDDRVVKELIIKRRLAPFYTPLEDFDPTWTDMEIVKIVDGLPLHASFDEHLEEYEDIPIGNLKKSDFEELIDSSLSKKERRRLRYKIFKARLYRKRIIWQDRENEKYLEKKIEDQGKSKESPGKNLFLPSDDLKKVMYKNGTECPICFLYFPQPMNHSKCCNQPICTECFVQIKRARPHFPHDEADPNEAVENEAEKDPHLLISEPASCPYCASPNFTITYTPPQEIRTGIGGIQPALFDIVKMENHEYSEILKKKKSLNMNNSGSASIINDGPSIITSDDIRPDWEHKLQKERKRLEKRSDNANAIHLSNQLIDSDHFLRRDSQTGYESSPTPTLSPTSPNCSSDYENDMVERAIRLSLEEEQKVSKKDRVKKRDSKRDLGITTTTTSSSSANNKSPQRIPKMRTVL
ncbi:hypothetical protein TBLA_0B08830 [Henningerozyma blattae CBS 6284]|uniref:Protein SIP5 n=1 Tax=Henningerozyma blattae (strain ATCC 34711 / CBS 6284 / DSM 70876 / NBRC 10599 / NRRL Y-10934 / UCD 77-7) TaxID=1071380 RepID=I2GZZ7_HENB6|nr:hypothetical protein TBLA_0B08830 [Tetrapisispora blattae CBS 6284]CCH59699.1 hypothetical protein TBLA_0B08830 [Tetrapisispora blattae CBS 6284]